jgi:6-phosphogluconolactonase (cycloisomerase 2 family)/uncharacterized protein YjdB
MRRNPGRLALAAVSLLCLAFLAACGGSNTPVLRGLTISPLSASIDNATTQQFTATAFYSNGSMQDVTSSAGWISSNPLVATIDPTGVATGVSNGTVTITATIVGGTATATLTVARTLQSIALTPSTPQTLALGLTTPYLATGTFLNLDGTTSTSDITGLVTWSSSNTTTATIDNTGVVTALATGTTNISASLSGINSPNAVLTVGAAVVTGLQVTPDEPTLAVGNSTTLVALELKSDGTTKPLTGPVTWALSDCTTAGATILASTATNGTEIAAGALAGGCTATATEGTLTGTSQVTVTPGTAHFAYVSNVGDATISQYAVDSTSTTAPLTPLTPPTVSTSQPTQVLVHPNGLFAYSVDSVSKVYLLDVDSGGAGTLTLDAANPPGGVPAGAGNGNYMVIDPTGRYLYVSDDGANTIDQTTGLLTSIGASTTSNLNSPESLLIDRTGKYLYAVNFGSNLVSAYTINQTTGALTPLAPTATFAVGAGPFFGTISPSNASLYVANSTDNTVTSFSLNSTNGALTNAAATPVSGATLVGNVVVDPTNAYLYVLDAGDGVDPGAVFAFALGSDGTIGAAIAGTPVATGVSPTGIIIDPTGTLLAVDNNFSNNISPFGVATDTGTPTVEPTVATGNGPLFVTFLNAP